MEILCEIKKNIFVISQVEIFLYFASGTNCLCAGVAQIIINIVCEQCLSKQQWNGLMKFDYESEGFLEHYNVMLRHDF